LLRKFTFKTFDAEMDRYNHESSPSITLTDIHLSSASIGNIIAENPNQRPLIINSLTTIFLQDLNTICQQHPFVFLWDAFEQASQEVKEWLTESFIFGVCDIPQVITVVSGQNVPLFKSIHWYDKFTSFELPSSLTWEDWLEYAEKIGALDMNKKDLHRHHKYYNGDPGTMCIVCDPWGTHE